MKTYDQWAEALSKEIFVRRDEKDTKIFWNMSDVFDEEFEEEEKVQEHKKIIGVRRKGR